MKGGGGGKGMKYQVGMQNAHLHMFIYRHSCTALKIHYAAENDLNQYDKLQVHQWGDSIEECNHNARSVGFDARPAFRNSQTNR